MRVWPKRTLGLTVLSALSAGLGSSLLLSLRMPVHFAVLAGLGVSLAIVMVMIRKPLRRMRIVKENFPEEWEKILEAEVPFYARLDEEGKKRFQNDVRFFLAEQNIYGSKGADVSTEVKLLVAASAAMLGHGMDDWEWPSLRDIVVYNTAFSKDYEESDKEHIVGMVHSQGPIIFSEKHLKHGFKVDDDGFNVGLHELAHVIDMAGGAVDGVPAGMDWVASAPWIKIVADRLCTNCRKRKKILNHYGYTNEAEFFAVAVETFFEKPDHLEGKDPELYEVLAEYFNIDPRTGKITKPS